MYHARSFNKSVLIFDLCTETVWEGNNSRLIYMSPWADSCTVSLINMECVCHIHLDLTPGGHRNMSAMKPL